eukprot:1266552-Prymnesium_polylepis.1
MPAADWASSASRSLGAISTSAAEKAAPTAPIAPTSGATSGRTTRSTIGLRLPSTLSRISSSAGASSDAAAGGSESRMAQILPRPAVTSHHGSSTSIVSRESMLRTSWQFCIAMMGSIERADERSRGSGIDSAITQ